MVFFHRDLFFLLRNKESEVSEKLADRLHFSRLMKPSARVMAPTRRPYDRALRAALCVRR